MNQLKETINMLINVVKIRQSFINLFKLTNDKEYLRLYDSYDYRLESLKREVRILDDYGPHRKYIKCLLGEKLQ